MNKTATPTRRKHTILKQLCEHILVYLGSKLAREHEVRSRSFLTWSQVVHNDQSCLMGTAFGWE